MHWQNLDHFFANRLFRSFWHRVKVYVYCTLEQYVGLQHSHSNQHTPKQKEIESQQQTLIFLFLHLCNLMSWTIDISNYKFCSSSNKSLKYQRFIIPLGGKVIVIRKFEFVAKTLLLDHLTTSILNFNDVIWDIALVG